MNSVMISGRLLRKPELKVHIEGKRKIYIAKYILVSRKLNANKDNDVNYIFCEARGNLAIFANKYFEQGKNIGVQGSLNTYSYYTADGVKENRWNILVNHQEFLEKKYTNGEKDCQF